MPDPLWKLIPSGFTVPNQGKHRISMKYGDIYPLVICYIAMEALAHRNRWFTELNSMVDLSMAMLCHNQRVRLVSNLWNASGPYLGVQPRPLLPLLGPSRDASRHHSPPPNIARAWRSCPLWFSNLPSGNDCYIAIEAMTQSK